MKKVLKLLFVIVSLSVVVNYAIPVGAADSKGIKTAYQLFKTMEMSKAYENTLNKIVEMQIQSNPHLEPFRGIMTDFFKKYMGWNNVKEELAALYASKFTVKEMNDLIKFYKTPTGKKSIKILPALYEQGSLIGQKKIQAHIPELQQKIMEKAKELQKESEKEQKKLKKK